jgi:hypothetical protein
LLIRLLDFVLEPEIELELEVLSSAVAAGQRVPSMVRLGIEAEGKRRKGRRLQNTYMLLGRTRRSEWHSGLGDCC